LAEITKDIFLAKKVLDANALVAIPTETVYGLAANGTSPTALNKIYEAKGRPRNNPLILHFKDLKSIAPYVLEITKDVELLTEQFWPGPLTLLLPKTTRVPEIVSAGSDRVAVRIPNHRLTLDLLNILEYPLAAPSANPSGYISPTLPKHVQKQLGTKISTILDGGPCDSGIESTILGWENNEPIIYRQGVITMAQIEKVINRSLNTKQGNGLLEAPGMSSSHYSPDTNTIVTDNVHKTLNDHKTEKVGLISIATHYPVPTNVIETVVLSHHANLAEVAQNLYTAMHYLDGLDLDVIIIELAPNEGIGKAINDRLLRSSSDRKK